MVDLSSPIVTGLIIVAVIASISFVLFLVALGSKKKVKRQTEKKYEQQKQNIKRSHEEALEKEHIQNKRTITEQ